jgi:hypothetical protein
MPTARYGLGLAAATNGKLYTVGGATIGAVYQTVEEYDPISDMWAARRPLPTYSPFSPATGYAGLFEGALAAADNGKLYAVSRVDSVEGGTVFLLEYDPIIDQWTPKSTFSSPYHYLIAAAPSTSKLYLVGPMIGGTDTREYDLTTNAWSTMASMPTSRTGMSLLGIHGGKIYAVGGSQGALKLNTVEEFTPELYSTAR